MGWKNNFDQIILDRGYDYYDWNYVENIFRIDDTVYATVMGNDDYTVTVNINDDEIADMNCTCPHAKESNNCKHMACVCYYIENKPIKKVKKPENTDKLFSDTITDNEFIEYVENKVKQMDYEFIVDTLVDILRINDEEFYEFMYMQDKTDDTDRLIYKKRLNNILNEEVDMINTEAFTDKLNNYIDATFGNLLLMEEFELLLDLIESVLTKTATIIYVNDTFEFEMIISNIDRLIDEILEKNTVYSKRVEDILKKLVDDYNSVFSEQFIQLYMKYVGDDSITQINILVRELEYTDEIFKIEKIEQIVELMKESDTNNDKIIEFLEENKTVPEIETILAPLYIENNQIEEAISLLEDACEDNAYSPRSVNALEQLKNIYINLEDERYVDVINRLIYKYNHYSRENIRLVREYYSNKWPGIEKKILEHYYKNDIYNYYQYLIDKGEYEKFRDVILEEADPYDIKEFQKILIDKYPDQLIETYKNMVYDTLLIADARNYRKAVEYIKEMKHVPNSEEEILQLTDELKRIYYRRTRLIKELDKI